MSSDDDHLLPRPRPHHEGLSHDGTPPPSPVPGPPDRWAPPDDVWHGPGPADVDAPDAVGRTVEDADGALSLLLGLVGRDRSGPPALWFVVLDAHDRVLPVVLPIPDVPTIADPVVASNLLHVLASVLAHDAPGGSLLVAYVRRGGGDRGAFESGWSAVLREAADRAGVRVRAEVAVGRDRARVLDPRW